MIGLGNSVVKRKLAGASVPSAPVNIVQPSLSGSGAVGEAVICNKGTWSGSPTPTYNYDFRLDSVSVQNGTSNSYTPLLADDGKTLTCLVTATNSQGSASEGTSNSIVIGVAPSNTVAPTLSPSGTQSTGTVITVGNGTFTGTAPLTYSYRWKRNGSIILGETANTYTIVAGDDGTVITAEVKATNPYGESAYIGTSNQVDAVNAIAPVNTAAPVVSGTAVVGQTLSSTTGTWTGIPTPTYSYQWYRGATLISGATNSTYTLVQADAGNTSNIKCVVTATNSAGSASADSNTVARILDTDTNTYITGLTLTSSEIDAYNTFFIDMRSSGNRLFDRLHIYAGATQSASNKSLYGNFTATPINSPTWTRKVGYTQTGTSFIKTGFTPSTNGVNYTRNAHTVISRIERVTTTNTIFTGTFDSTLGSSFYINWKASGGIDYSDYGTAMVDVFTGTTIANKLFAAKRTSSSSITLFRDASSSVVANNATTNLQTNEWYDAARNVSNAGNLPLGNGDKIIYSGNGGSGIDVATVNTLILNLISAL